MVSHHAPGGCNIEGEDESWDFGTGAGFYVDATQEPWKNNYRMYSYITEEVHLSSATCSPEKCFLSADPLVCLSHSFPN